MRPLLLALLLSAPAEAARYTCLSTHSLPRCGLGTPEGTRCLSSDGEIGPWEGASVEAEASGCFMEREQPDGNHDVACRQTFIAEMDCDGVDFNAPGALGFCYNAADNGIYAPERRRGGEASERLRRRAKDCEGAPISRLRQRGVVLLARGGDGLGARPKRRVRR